MHTRKPIRCARTALFIALSSTSTLGLARMLVARISHRTTFEDLLVELALAVLALTSLWATTILLTVLIEAFTAGRTRRLSLALCPRAWRNSALLLCGAALVAGATAPTYAVGSAPRWAPGPGQLPHLDRPDGRLIPGPAALVVRRGDSLWRLVAQRHPGSSAADIARLTQALYLGNRPVIGDDPDVIWPGQRLSPTDHEERKNQ